MATRTALSLVKELDPILHNFYHVQLPQHPAIHPGLQKETAAQVRSAADHNARMLQHQNHPPLCHCTTQLWEINSDERQQGNINANPSSTPSPSLMGLIYIPAFV